MSHSVSRATATTTAARFNLVDTSVGDLIGDVTHDQSTLTRQEFELATAELKQELIQTGKAAGALGGAAFAGQMVLLFVSLALWLTLATLKEIPNSLGADRRR
jgi:hypothetical protein